MARRTSTTVAILARHSRRTEASGGGDDLLSAFFKSSTVGVAICDRQLRYRAINDALASTNRISAQRHLGKTIHAVLGKAATKIRPAFEHGFAVGQPLSDFEVIAELPSRRGIGHWNESYFPIKDHGGGVQQVGVVVFELTKRKDLEAALFRLTDKMARITSAVPATSGIRESSYLGCEGVEDVCAGPAGLVLRVKSEQGEGAEQRRPVECQKATARLRVYKRANSPASNRRRSGMPHSTIFARTAGRCASGYGQDQPRSCHEAAMKLLISTRTVESHRAKIMLKLDLHSLSDLVLYAVRGHLIQA